MVKADARALDNIWLTVAQQGVITLVANNRDDAFSVKWCDFYDGHSAV
jgi:hypothetical protein